MNGPLSPFDISPDDSSGNAITTRQLGMAMAEAARLTGRQIDLYGSDACLMSMIEIATEMADSVKFFVGSQETEPGDGWPYEAFLAQWMKQPKIDAPTLSKLLTHVYFETYSGSNGPRKDATLSALDLAQIGPVNTALREFAESVRTLATPRKTDVLRAIRNSLQFTLTDYVDVGDFLRNVERVDVSTTAAIAPVRAALSNLVISNEVTPRYSRASGISIWIPNNRDLLDRFGREYERLKFHQETRWGDALRVITQ